VNSSSNLLIRKSCYSLRRPHRPYVALWKTPKVEVLRSARIVCPTCQRVVPCKHLKTDDFQINRRTHKLRPHERKITGQRKSKGDGDKLKAGHAAQSVRKPTLHEAWKYQVSHPTAAGDHFHMICQSAFPNMPLVREHICGYYIMDFYFPLVRLCVEIDGKIHEDAAQREHDAKRTAYFKRVRGVRTLRFKNDQVLTEREMVLKVLSREFTDNKQALSGTEAERQPVGATETLKTPDPQAVPAATPG